jgi:hypothetical protein
MNQNDNLEVKPITEKRISASAPLHQIWNAYRDWRVRKREESYKNYQETVQDYVQDQ